VWRRETVRLFDGSKRSHLPVSNKFIDNRIAKCPYLRPGDLGYLSFLGYDRLPYKDLVESTISLGSAPLSRMIDLGALRLEDGWVVGQRQKEEHPLYKLAIATLLATGFDDLLMIFNRKPKGIQLQRTGNQTPYNHWIPANAKLSLYVEGVTDWNSTAYRLQYIIARHVWFTTTLGEMRKPA